MVFILIHIHYLKKRSFLPLKSLGLGFLTTYSESHVYLQRAKVRTMTCQ